MNLLKRIWFAAGGIVAGILAFDAFAARLGHGVAYWYVFAFLLLGSAVGSLTAAFR